MSRRCPAPTGRLLTQLAARSVAFIKRATTEEEKEAAFKRFVKVRAQIIAKHRETPPKRRHVFLRGEPRHISEIISEIIPEAIAMAGATKTSQ
jgi:hypothetical protein